MSTERKQGVIWSFNPAKGVGTIIDSTDQRWFFHAGRVIAGPARLDVGMIARFIIQTDEKPKAGRLPSAFEIEISNYAGIEALAESSKEAK